MSHSSGRYSSSKSKKNNLKESCSVKNPVIYTQQSLFFKWLILISWTTTKKNMQMLSSREIKRTCPTFSLKSSQCSSWRMRAFTMITRNCWRRPKSKKMKQIKLELTDSRLVHRSWVLSMEIQLQGRHRRGGINKADLLKIRLGVQLSRIWKIEALSGLLQPMGTN